jgi:hypothetical protein
MVATRLKTVAYGEQQQEEEMVREEEEEGEEGEAHLVCVCNKF